MEVGFRDGVDVHSWLGAFFRWEMWIHELIPVSLAAQGFQQGWKVFYLMSFPIDKIWLQAMVFEVFISEEHTEINQLLIHQLFKLANKSLTRMSHFSKVGSYAPLCRCIGWPVTI